MEEGTPSKAKTSGSESYVAGKSSSKEDNITNKTTILYVIIGVLSVAVVVLAVLLALGVGGSDDDYDSIGREIHPDVDVPGVFTLSPSISPTLSPTLLPTTTATTGGTNNITSNCQDNATESELGDYLVYARDSIESLGATVCELETQNPSLSGSCEAIAQLRAGGEIRDYNEILPEYFYVNFLGMTVAYAMTNIVLTDPTLVYGIFITALRHHRALTYGNALRLQGWPEDVVQTAYWNHHKNLEAEDASVPPTGDGLGEYCAYINTEYEQLKQYARNKFGEEQLPLVSSFDSTELLGTWCQLLYIVRNDWESHRREVVSSLMSNTCSRPIILYTLWHWEAVLGVGTISGEESLSLLFESFDVIAETYTSPDAFPC